MQHLLCLPLIYQYLRNFKKINQSKAESLAKIAEYDAHINGYKSNIRDTTTASLTNSTSINHGTAWSVKRSIQHVQHVEEDGFITFTVDSGADVTVKHGNGNGLDNFDCTSSISLEVADQRLVSTKGMGEIAGKITNIHVAPSFATSLLSVYQMYKKEGKAVLFHPTPGILLANASHM